MARPRLLTAKRAKIELRVTCEHKELLRTTAARKGSRMSTWILAQALKKTGTATSARSRTTIQLSKEQLKRVNALGGAARVREMIDEEGGALPPIGRRLTARGKSRNRPAPLMNSTQTSFYLTEEHRMRLRQLGGSAWVQEMIDREWARWDNPA